jgi:hypothetical protein
MCVETQTSKAPTQVDLMSIPYTVVSPAIRGIAHIVRKNTKNEEVSSIMWQQK